MVLNINAEEERISLGIKQLHEDPWGRIPQAYPRGARVKGKVQKITDFGAFIEIEPGIEGLCHVSEFDDARVENARDFLKIGQDVDVMIIDVDAEERKIGLSIKAVKKAEEGTDYRAYLASTKGESRATLGDLLKDKLQK
ncbi:MAG: S1 RNA-binding domain-containing protein [Deltaproteobacteria bacterium]|nr:S1 RNA-binding domain-containing protein [Deltaproteobacteria bacterium]